LGAKIRFWGLFGELLAVSFFVLCGYRLLAWRRRFGRLEADLIVGKRGETILVEVKTSLSGNPERLFSHGKARNMRKILGRGGGGITRVELFFVDLSGFLPRFRRSISVCLG
jgi:hypothetical protein